mgnify:FL=1
MLTVVIDQSEIEAIWVAVEADPKTQVKVDLEAKTVSYGSKSISFAIDDYTRWRLMEGLDDIGLTLKNIDLVSAFEESRPSFKPKTLPALS